MEIEIRLQRMHTSQSERLAAVKREARLRVESQTTKVENWTLRQRETMERANQSCMMSNERPG